MEEQETISYAPPTAEPKLIGVGDLLKASWKIYKSKFWTFMGIMAVTVLAGLAWNFALRALGISPFTAIADFGWFSGILLLFVCIVVSIFIGFLPQIALLYVIKEREQGISVQEAFMRAFSKVIPYVWIFFLNGFIAFGGLMLLAIPGLIFTFWFIFGEYVLIAEDKKGMNALFRSKQLVKGHWWAVTGRLFAMLFIVMIFVLPVSFLVEKLRIPIVENIIVLLIAPIFSIFAFLIYENLAQIKSDMPFEPPSGGKKLAFISAGIIGIIAFVGFIILFIKAMSIFPW